MAALVGRRRLLGDGHFTFYPDSGVISEVFRILPVSPRLNSKRTMMPKREAYENWIRRYLKPRYPELVKTFRACWNGYERIKTNNRVDKNSLKSIIRAARSPRGPLFDTATGFLATLSAHYPEVREAILRMSNDKHWYVRSHALFSLGHGTPRNLVLAVLRKGLQDRSARVRGLAALQAQFLRIYEIIPDLENQFAIEPHQSVKYSIDFHLRLLRDGYFLESENRERPLIWIPIRDGIRSSSVSQEEIDTTGIQAVILDIRSKPYG